MPKTGTNPAKPPRFPIAGALLCAACVGAAVWTWMRYSYAWDVSGGALWDVDWSRCGPSYVPERCREEYHDRYVRLCGKLADVCGRECVVDDGFGLVRIYLGGTTDLNGYAPGQSATFYGRAHVGALSSSPPLRLEFVDLDWIALMRAPFVDASASRFHPASVSGFVVGAMGVFVFAIALRHWLGERRATTALEAS